MVPVYLAAVDVDNAFHRDSSPIAALAAAVTGGNSNQTAFRPRSATGADTLSFRESAEIGEPPDSSLPTTPQATNHIRQPTARRARRIARYAATSAVPASVMYTHCCCTSFC